VPAAIICNYPEGGQRCKSEGFVIVGRSGKDRKNEEMGFDCLDLAVTRKVTLDKFSFIFKPAFSQENRTNMSWSLQMMFPYHNLERSLSELRRKLKKKAFVIH